MAYCPYRGSETEEEFNVEHIIPEAIGGRQDYAIQVSKGINSHFGDTIDAALVNHPQVRALCIHYGIKGKRGLPELKLRGDAVTSDLKFDFSATDVRHIKVRVHNPVASDPDDASQKVLTYMNGDGDQEMARINKDMGRKGKDVVWEEEQSLDEVEVILQNEGNPVLAALGLAKIAFGGLIHEFPEYSHAPLADAWRRLLNAEDNEQVTQAGIEFSAYNQLAALKAVVPEVIQPWEHIVSIADCGSAGIFVAISLFGLENFHFIALASTTSHYGMEKGKYA